MTDDAELRARIEAQVAARRAGSPASENGHPALEDVDGDEPRPPLAPPGAPRSLTPTRPWARGPQPAPNGFPDSVEPASEPPTDTGARWRGIGPARPWAGRSAEFPAVPPSDAAGDGRLRPARPWRTRPAPESPQPARADAEAPGPAPSHPDIVLRAISRETGSEDGPAPEGYPEVAESMPELPAAEAPPEVSGRRRMRWRERLGATSDTTHDEPEQPWHNP
ncbi:MAG TPA: hypothetical protein VE442_09045, partial [Jatrophihabitans sp.]|nr:hypothetical protein [Jatrophihabitans sp.]